jgi:hypothetical protein
MYSSILNENKMNFVQRTQHLLIRIRQTVKIGRKSWF